MAYTEQDEIMADLAHIDEDADTAGIAPAVPKGNSDNLDVPDGRYHARLDRLCFEQTKTKKMTILNWEMIIDIGEQAGKLLTSVNFTDSTEKIGWMKKDLCNAGMDAANMTLVQIHEALPELLDVILDVTVKHKGTGDDEKAYVYINGHIDREEDVPTGQASANSRTTTPAPRTSSRTSTASPASGGSSRGLSRM